MPFLDLDADADLLEDLAERIGAPLDMEPRELLMALGGELGRLAAVRDNLRFSLDLPHDATDDDVLAEVRRLLSWCDSEPCRAAVRQAEADGRIPADQRAWWLTKAREDLGVVREALASMPAVFSPENRTPREESCAGRQEQSA